MLIAKVEALYIQIDNKLLLLFWMYNAIFIILERFLRAVSVTALGK